MIIKFENQMAKVVATAKFNDNASIAQPGARTYRSSGIDRHHRAINYLGLL
jgi:hypothetical protein